MKVKDTKNLKQGIDQDQLCVSKEKTGNDAQRSERQKRQGDQHKFV